MKPNENLTTIGCVPARNTVILAYALARGDALDAREYRAEKQ
jgi:7-cyano-7-deazaguanine synthase in queuosine biosynthesis